MNIAELRKYGSGGRPRTARAWFDRLDNEEKKVVAGVILSQTAPVALDALREHANFPFKKTALKELRYQLEKENA
ncbi:hypothetical protein [Corynebacterium sp.]|uniref:hypothetical protein n=1 Tax=Corynebacterium sp. TaxID=1720 RepID=UPI0028AB6237|nr:hypothetical protein [Corynebacterium sp.]